MKNSKQLSICQQVNINMLHYIVNMLHMCKRIQQSWEDDQKINWMKGFSDLNIMQLGHANERLVITQGIQPVKVPDYEHE